MKTFKEAVQEKLERVIQGETVVCSENEYFGMIQLSMRDEYSDKTDNLVSVWNNNRVGINDALLAYLKIPFEGFTQEGE